MKSIFRSAGLHRARRCRLPFDFLIFQCENDSGADRVSADYKFCNYNSPVNNQQFDAIVAQWNNVWL